MNERDPREELIDKIAIGLSGQIQDTRDLKNTLYAIMDKYEIQSRTTEVALLNEDRNEYLIKEFLAAKMVMGCTDRTIQFYGQCLKHISERMQKTFDDYDAATIRVYIAKRLKVDKVTACTCGNEVRALSSFFTWLTDQEIIQKNPMRKVERVRAPKKKKEALTDMEVEQLRAACRDERETALIELLLSTGCRVSEVVQILLVEMEPDRILVHGKGQKDRFVYLNAKAQFAIDKYLQKREDSNPYLFPGFHGNAMELSKLQKEGFGVARRFWDKPECVSMDSHIDKCTVEEITRKLAKRAGVARANPHKFRRTCATRALQNGMPIEQVSKMLGHEDLSTTQIYLALTEDELREAHKKYVR